MAMVIWLMIYQRLHEKGTLAAAVQQLARLAENGPLYWSDQCKRILQGRISANTGGYCQARQKLPTLVASRVSEHIFEQLRQQMPPPNDGPAAFVIDGTTIRLAHERDLVESFPPGVNQHGENHWPILNTVVFHDVYTGLAAAPHWGPMYGSAAVSEQELASQALQQLPPGAMVLADGNFGIFAFAYVVQQSQRPLLARLTAVRARRLLGPTLPPAGTRRKVTWNPSPYERKAHPDLPAEASVTGWAVVCRNPAHGSETLYLFTTLDWEPERVLEMYKLRWNIETDLRSLKQTVRLHQITGKAKAMVEKELLLAVAAYNIIRAVIYLAACRQGLPPRRFSFSLAQDAVMAAWGDLQRATTEDEYTRQMELLLSFVSKAKLPQRKRSRSYPREIWGRGGHFPFRKSAPLKESGQ
jgi:putative transposase